MKRQMVFQRYELKFMLTQMQQQHLLSVMADRMEEDAFPHSSIRNLYLDTPDFRLIRRSLERPVYKEKVRLRSYGQAGEGDTVFAELKKKYRSVVYKRRLAMPQGEAMACLSGTASWPDSQIGGEIAYTLDYYGSLAPAVFLSYERDSYRSLADDGLRLTFDRDIRFRREALSLDTAPWGQPLLTEDQVLMEVKSPGALPLWLVGALSDMEVRKTSFSKYGAAYRSLLRQEWKGVKRYA